MNSLPRHIQRIELLAEGVHDNGIRARKRQSLAVVRPGTYVAKASWSELDSAARHRLLVTSTLGKLRSPAVVSHFSAAAMHGLPVLGAFPARVHVTRQGASGGFNRGQLHTHVGQLSDDLLTTVDDVLVTSVLRTLLDCALTGRFEAAVVMIDHALHHGIVSHEALTEAVAAARHRRGSQQAVKAVAFADHRSESPGESFSRVCLARAGLAAPELQFLVSDDQRVVGRTDFAWEDCRTLGEFDGKVKYGRLLKPGQDPGDVVFLEKKREDELRELGWEVVRWIWAELFDFTRVALRIQRAFERGMARS